MISLRNGLTNSVRNEQSAAITDRLRELPFPNPNAVASYTSWASEPSTAAIHQTLQNKGIQILVPAGGLQIGWRLLDGNVLPRESLKTAELVIVPALAVDFAGTRLGRGAGWYDRMLLHRSPDAILVALLFEGEFLTDQLLPKEEHDIPMDYVVTPSAVHKINPH